MVRIYTKKKKGRKLKNALEGGHEPPTLWLTATRDTP